MIPGDGYLPACVPAVVDTWAAAVARFGTMSFSQILQPAIELADNGFPLDGTQGNLAGMRLEAGNGLEPVTIITLGLYNCFPIYRH